MPGKRKTATKLELFYIQQNPDGKTPQELADYLGLFKTTVEKIIDATPKVEVSSSPEEVEAEPEPQQKVNKMQNFILNNKRKGEEDKPGRVAIMTGTASEYLDDANKIARQKAKRPENQTGIAKPYPDRP